MQQRTINPWKWQDQLGFAQAIEVSGAQSVLYCAGQSSMDAQGRPANKGDMRGQITLAMDNLEEVLRHAGATLSNVVRLNYYTTDVDRFFAAHYHSLEGGWMPARKHTTWRVTAGLS